MGNFYSSHALDTIALITFQIMLAAAKYLGAGFACSGLIGAGVK